MESSTESHTLISRRFIRNSSLFHVLVILLTAAFLCLPCLIHGLPLAGDTTLHATYQYYFSRQFWNGEIYPRWLMDANDGYGSPIFLIQYPLPYWTTALLRPLTRFAPTPVREARELGVFCFLVLAAAGLSARIWLRKRRSALTATIGAIVYISLPCLLAFDLYSDFPLGQFTIFAWMPLALAACESLRLKFTAVSALGIVWALLVLSNFLAALLFLPLMVGYAIVCRESRHTSLGEAAASIFVALAIGSSLAAAYLLPFFAYLRLFDIRALLSLPGYELSHHFAYVRLASVGTPLVAAALAYAILFVAIAMRSSLRPGDLLALRVGKLLTLGLGALMVAPGLGLWLVACSGLKAPIFRLTEYLPEKLLVTDLLTIALAVFADDHVSEDSSRRRDHLLLLLLGTASASFILMLPWSAFLWKAIPELATAVQFPHRLGLLLAISTTGLFAAALDSGLKSNVNGEGNRRATLMILMAIAVVAGGILTWRTDWMWYHVLRDPPRVRAVLDHDVDHTYRTYVPQDDVAGFARLIGADLNNNDIQLPHVECCTGSLVQGQGSVSVVRQGPRKLLVAYNVAGDGLARIGVLYSPLWRVEPTGQTSSIPVLRSSADGLIEVPLVPGRHVLEIAFDAGWPERYGVMITLISILLVGGGVLIQLLVSRA
jgi:hypothetical protein